MVAVFSDSHFSSFKGDFHLVTRFSGQDLTLFLQNGIRCHNNFFCMFVYSRLKIYLNEKFEKKFFWPIFNSSFSYKSGKNENKINLASKTEEAWSINIQSKNQLDSQNTFLVILVSVFEKTVLRKTRLQFSVWFIMKKRLTTRLQYQSRTVLLSDDEFSMVHRFEKCKKNSIFCNARGGTPP